LSRVGEGGRVHHDGIESGLRPDHRAERLEGVSLLPADVAEPIERCVPGASPQRLDPNDLQEVIRRPSRGFPQWISKWFSRAMAMRGEVSST